MEAILQERVMENRDWATVLFVLCFVLIAVTKTTFESRFSDFSKLLFSDKYNKIYKDSSHLMSWFNIALFAVQLISLAFFAQLLLAYFGFVGKADWLVYIQIITLIGVFILSKYLIEKIISTSFNMEEFVEQYNLQKVNYRTYISLLLLPVNVFLFYNNNV